MQAQDVTRRVIFYVPGFDPFPLRRYRELAVMPTGTGAEHGNSDDG